MSDDQLYEHVYYSKRTPTLDAYQTPELLQQTQEQADEIVEIMRENINKVMARQIKLEDLNETAESVERLASNFQVGAVKVKRKKWWAQMRAKIALGVAVFIFILFVIGTVVSAFNGRCTSVKNCVVAALRFIFNV